MKVMGSKELCNTITDTSLDHHMLSSWGRCKGSRSNQEPEACSTEDPSMIDSSDWITDTRPRKRLRRTYSSKSNVQAPVPDPIPVSRREQEKSAGDILRMIDKTFLIGFTELRDDHGGLALQGMSDDMPDNFPNAPTSSVEWEVGCGQKTPLRGAFTKLARNLSPMNWRTLDGLHDGVLALLKATADEKPKELRLKATLPTLPREYRSRSLFATCLRKIPDCIIEEQLSTTIEDPENDVDVSTMMYNDLEQMNTSGTGGWRPLKEVVRAHGIAILVSAIKESLINLPMARALMLLCVEHGAYDEAVTIVKAMITTMKPLPKPETPSSLLYAFRTSVTLQTVQTMGMLTRYSKFEFDSLAKLFDASIISFEWMYTPDMVDCWNRAVISATQGRSDGNDAASLLCTVVAKAHRMNSPSLLEKVQELRLQSGRKSRKVQKLGKKNWSKNIQAASLSDDGEEADVLWGDMINVFSNLLTVLCATSLLQSSRASVLTDIGQEARRSDELHSCVSSQGHSCDINHDHLGLSLLASTIATQPPDHHCLDALIRGITKTTPDFHVTAGTFLCNVAQCCGRVALKDPFEHLRDLINCLGHGVANRTYDESRRATFNAIYINAAFKLAEQSGQPKHFEGALALEQRLGGGKAEHAFRTPGKTPRHSREQARSGFRWEEGICEWVAQSAEAAQEPENACSDEAAVVQESSKEEDIASSIHQSFQDIDHLAENSPCARRIPKPESHEYLTENHSKCSNPEAGSGRIQRRRGRGRPTRTLAQKRKLHDPIVSDISVKDKPSRLGSSHEWRNCVRQGCCAAPRIRRVGPIVVIEKAKLDVMFRAKGTVKAMSQGTGKGFKSDTESEDELSLL
ncbi:hypothetical protein G7Y79_00009g026640 [Physcia stellaris]|nr:hypothetical protein G7Y79_00009g026640 [Physcia stellaris]